MFTQSVFDLHTTCAWDEFARNIPIIISLVEMQIARGVTPTVLPFHSLHYPLKKESVRRLAELHSQQCWEKVLGNEGGPGRKSGQGQADDFHLWTVCSLYRHSSVLLVGYWVGVDVVVGRRGGCM